MNVEILVATLAVITIICIYGLYQDMRMKELALSELPPAPGESTLTIYLIDKSFHSYTYEGPPHFGANITIKKFAKWYFGKPDHPSYFLPVFEGGGDVLKRSSICAISLRRVNNG